MSKQIKIAHLYPELLNLYGDSGNMLSLKKRLEWRSIPCEICEVHFGEVPSFNDIDFVFIGGGSDREQAIVCESLLKVQSNLKSFVEDGGVVAAVCGGYQLLGHSYLMGDTKLQGLSLVDMYTDRGDPRIIGNIIIETDFLSSHIVGYENHGGRTYLSDGVSPLGKVIFGRGNDGVSGFEGVHYKNVIGTYIHGPLFPKNPEITDFLLQKAVERKFDGLQLEPLDDAVEKNAAESMIKRLLSGQVEE